MLAYKCASTGLLFPGDYIEEWGRKYGIGLGPNPCSEALESCYETAPSLAPRDIQSEDQIGHGVRACGAPVFPVEVSEQDFEKGKAILALDDGNYRKRWAVMKAIQNKNPRSRRTLALSRSMREA